MNEILLSVSDMQCCSWVWSICCSKRKYPLLCVTMNNKKNNNDDDDEEEDDDDDDDDNNNNNNNNVYCRFSAVLSHVTHSLSDYPVNIWDKRNILRLRKGWSLKGIGCSEDES